MSEKCFLYEIYCMNPKVDDKYLGYTTEWEKCMEYHEEKSRNPGRSRLYFEIYANGGWDNWNVEVLKEVKGRKKAIAEKMKLLQKSDEYTLNTHVRSLKPVYRVQKDGTQVIL